MRYAEDLTIPVSVKILNRNQLIFLAYFRSIQIVFVVNELSILGGRTSSASLQNI